MHATIIVGDAPSGLALTIEEAAVRVRARDGALHALVHSRVDEALAEAARRAGRGRTGPLDTLPYVLKDVWDTASIPTTGGSWPARNRIPATSAPIYTALEAAGAILLGKSSVPDLAFTPDSENFLVGRTANPHDVARTAGGSSSGGAAAVAAGMAAFDWGSDFGGSIRLPAAFCGVIGLRLSASCWPVKGHFPVFPPELGLNGMGPIAPDLDVLDALLDVLAPSLRTSPPSTWTPRSLAVYGPDDFAAGAWPHFTAEIKTLLAPLELPLRDAIELPPPRDVDRVMGGYLATHLPQIFAGRVTSTATAAASALTFGRWVGDRRLHPGTAAIIGRLALARVLVHRDRTAARRRVDELRATARQLWDGGHVIVLPTSGFSAPHHGKALATAGCTSFAKLGNLVDATGLAVPWGRFPDGLPRSLQLLGPPGSERALIALARHVYAIAPRA